MRFTLIKDIRRDKPMKLMLTYLLLFILLFVLLSPVVQGESFGYEPQSLQKTFFGDPQEFSDPLNSEYFLEYLHTEIFLVMMSVFLLSTLYVRLHVKSRFYLGVIIFENISALVHLLFFALYFYFAEMLFAYIYFTSFLLWLGVSLSMTLSSLKRLHFG